MKCFFLNISTFGMVPAYFRPDQAKDFSAQFAFTVTLIRWGGRMVWCWKAHQQIQSCSKGNAAGVSLGAAGSFSTNWIYRIYSRSEFHMFHSLTLAALASHPKSWCKLHGDSSTAHFKQLNVDTDEKNSPTYQVLEPAHEPQDLHIY